MDLVRHQYTWERGRGTNAWIEIRIDTDLVSREWLSLFPADKLYNIEVFISDHSPILLEPDLCLVLHTKRMFRFI